MKKRTFPEAARRKAMLPAARRKAVATYKKTLARKRALEAQGKLDVLDITSLPTTRPPKAKRPYTRQTPGLGDRVQLARELIALVSQLTG